MPRLALALIASFLTIQVDAVRIQDAGGGIGDVFGSVKKTLLGSAMKKMDVKEVVREDPMNFPSAAVEKADRVLTIGKSKILIASTATYSQKVLDLDEDFRKTCAAVNLAQAENYGHSFIVRETRTRGDEGLHPAWEKIAMLNDYINRGYDYVLAIDIDAVMAKPKIDVAKEMMEQLEQSGKDILLTDCQGVKMAGFECLHHKCINTGVMMAKATDWARNFTRDMMQTPHTDMCSQWKVKFGWENNCMAKLCQKKPSDFKDHMLILQGDHYNRASGSMLTYKNKCMTWPYTPLTGMSLRKCEEFGKQGLKHESLRIMHLMPYKMGADSLLIDVVEDYRNHFGEPNVRLVAGHHFRRTED